MNFNQAWTKVLFLWFCAMLSASADDWIASANIQSKQIRGEVYVSANSLRQKGIEIKSIPDQDKLAVCTSTKCVLISDFIRDEQGVWLAADLLTEVGAKLVQESGNWRIEINMPGERETATTIGRFAPSLQFTLLDGRNVSLSDFAGKRVLINSWASW